MSTGFLWQGEENFLKIEGGDGRTLSKYTKITELYI